MKYYQEIKVIDGTGMNENTVLSDVCGIIHNILSVSGDDVNIGISFPEYTYNARRDKSTLGFSMRVFALTQKELEQLDLSNRLDNFNDYINLTEITQVGDKATHYEIYTRCRLKNTERKAEKLYKHFLNKHGEDVLVEKFGDFQGVLEHCEKTNKDFKHLPFINATSNSNGNDYIIKLKRQIIDKPSNEFVFNNYGINNTKSSSTVPAW